MTIKIYKANIDRIEGQNREFYKNSGTLQYPTLNNDWYVHNSGIRFSLKKEGDSDRC